MLRIYLVTKDGDYMFEGTLAQFEDCFGGVGGTEDGLSAVCEHEGWDAVLIEVPEDYYASKEAYHARGVRHGWDAVEAGELAVAWRGMVPEGAFVRQLRKAVNAMQGIRIRQVQACGEAKGDPLAAGRAAELADQADAAWRSLNAVGRQLDEHGAGMDKALRLTAVGVFTRSATDLYLASCEILAIRRWATEYQTKQDEDWAAAGQAIRRMLAAAAWS